MARLYDPSPEQQASWDQWVASRPANVRAVAENFDPWSLYRIKATGQRCTLVSFGEADDGSVTLAVAVTGEHNLTMFDRKVFGLNPHDIEPCDPAPPGETVGIVLTDLDAIDSYIDAIRPMVLARRRD